jgi:5S rRNA maturation endonuclease (ribonuclease M5)
MMNQLISKKKYRSYSQEEIKNICDHLCDNLDNICELFNLDCRYSPKMLTMCCPIHGGDNPSALNLYHVGEDYKGNWICRTHHCEEIFQPSLIGFLRGILSVTEKNWSKEGDEMYPFNQTLDFALKILKKDIKDLKVKTTDREKRIFTKNIHTIAEVKDNSNHTITRNIIRKTLQIPATYYVNRNFSKDILDKYDIGTCNNPNKEMFERVVVPIYDPEYSYMVGCTGRSIHEKCNKCNYYHDSDKKCVDGTYAWKYSKWKHNKTFKSKDHLYNLWFAKKYISQTGKAIIVESPGNVWRLEEAGIHNSVGIFGTSLGDKQKLLLDCSGAMSLIVILDPDEAGQEGVKKIRQKCSRTYNISTISLSNKDIADMSVEEVQDLIIPQIEGVK